uniref:inorganic diphosphatase n=1 Tax=Byssovorax cruenta TaxID=293647 RepID=A0A3S5GXZ6_9BACT|nr:inorganic pyrophosphatase [Byssovorax cruenta]
MSSTTVDPLDRLFSLLFKAHPWHGISPGPDAPSVVTTYIEILPTDGVKYELDKASGHLKVDRPQRYSSLCPTLYGFIPQTYCGPEVAKLCEARTTERNIRGDGDPLDICVLTERTIANGDILVRARPVGGLRLLDGHEADDKIIAVLEEDAAFGALTELSDCPKGLVDRIIHYFLSYKELPGTSPRKVEILETYGREAAAEVIRASARDYESTFGSPEQRLTDLRRLLGK